ncbi:hypothetical protein OGAPHI_003131 [Ogataea philodendri]|uniref:DUF2470 domain-containing protein n=1 Tax=Ogataea philodendri TaxID=1378263 RepID=A0A9P8P9Y1_9ASCO|nr:uncharacterized protein OGAPHI_003131 [Ogataea philodendri]KAH3667482.1 hypothetical protein OGAPHI_003131 [Ogataea philodendri]
MSLTSTSLVAVLNKEFKPNLEDLLAVYGEVKIDDKIKNIKAKEVGLDHLTIVFNHDSLEVEMLKPIPFDKPLQTYEQVQTHLLQLARQAAEKRKLSHLQVQQVWYPQNVIEKGIVIAVCIMMAGKVMPNFTYNVVLTRVLPFPNHWLEAFRPYNDFVLMTAITLHAIEVAIFMVSRFYKYRVPADAQLEWLVLTTIEGYFCIRRFDQVVAHRAKVWQHYEDGGKLIDEKEKYE